MINKITKVSITVLTVCFILDINYAFGIPKIDKKVYLGYDVFKESYVDLGNIKNVGVVINHTSSIVSIDNNTNIISSNISGENLKIRKIFTPEHGLNNAYQAGDKVPGSSDYNIPIISLYGNQLKPLKILSMKED